MSDSKKWKRKREKAELAQAAKQSQRSACKVPSDSLSVASQLGQFYQPLTEELEYEDDDDSLNDENLCFEASMWVRQNSCKEGSSKMTAQFFCQWVNDDLLPSRNLPPELPRSISVVTATRWLERLGFHPQSPKKGSYVDGHEHEDVIKSRDQYLKVISELKATHLPPPPPSDERAATPPETRKKLVCIFHDESINEGQSN